MGDLVPLFISGVFAQVVFLLWLAAFSFSFLRAAGVALLAGVLMFWALTA